MSVKTPGGYIVPDLQDEPNVPLDMMALGMMLDRATEARFATLGERDGTWPASVAPAGSRCYITSTGRRYRRVGTPAAPAWVEQLEDGRYVVTSTTRALVGDAAVRGARILETDTGQTMEYQTGLTGWTKPWDVPWGIVNGGVSATNGWSPPNVTGTGQATYRTDFVMHPGRNYRFFTQTTFFSGTSGTGRWAFSSFGQFTTVADQNTGIGATGNFYGHLYGGVIDDWVSIYDEWVKKGSDIVSTPTPVSYRYVAQSGHGGGQILNVGVDNLVHCVTDLGPIGAPTA